MSMVAAGACLRFWREQRGLSRSDLVRLLKADERQIGRIETDERQIARIETGQIDTRGSMLAAFTQAVRGSFDVVAKLLLDENATAEDGQRFAQEWLTQEQLAQIEHMAASVPRDQIDSVIAKIEQLQADPEAMARLVGYVERLVEEQLEQERREREPQIPPVALPRRWPLRRKSG